MILESLCMTLVYFSGLLCVLEGGGGGQYHSPVDFQLAVKLDSISLPGICTECHTGWRSSGSDLIINEHCSRESAGWSPTSLQVLMLIVRSVISHDCAT